MSQSRTQARSQSVTSLTSSRTSHATTTVTPTELQLSQALAMLASHSVNLSQLQAALVAAQACLTAQTQQCELDQSAWKEEREMLENEVRELKAALKSQAFTNQLVAQGQLAAKLSQELPEPSPSMLPSELDSFRTYQLRINEFESLQAASQKAFQQLVASKELEYESSLRSKNDMIHQLKLKLADYDQLAEAMIQEQTKQLQTRLQEQSNNHATQIKSIYEQQVKQLTNELSATQSLNHAQATEIAQFKQEVDLLKLALKAKELQFTEYKKKSTANAKQLKATSDLVYQKVEENHRVKEEIQQKYAELTKEKESLEAKLVEITKEKDTLKETQAKLQEELSSLKSSRIALQPSSTQTANEVTADSKKVLEQAVRIEQLKSTIEAQKAKISEWKQTVVNYRTWHDKVVAAIKEKHEQELAELKANTSVKALSPISETAHENETSPTNQDDQKDTVIPASAPIVLASTALVAALPTSTALIKPFPQPLSRGATTKQHMTNLFAQVDAIKSQLKGLNRDRPVQSQTQPMVPSSSSTITPCPPELQQKLTAADSPIVQQIQSASKSTASINAHPEDHTKSVLSLNTETQSFCTTASLDSSNASAPSILSTLSNQLTTLSSSSTSFDQFMRNMAEQISGYHKQIHQLQAQVDHYKTKEQTANKDYEQLKKDLALREHQLAEVERLIHLFLSQITSLQSDFHIYEPHREEGEDGLTLNNPIHFFATLHHYLIQLCEHKTALMKMLESSEANNRQLQLLWEGEKELAWKWKSEVMASRQLQDEIESLRSELKQYQASCEVSNTNQTKSCIQKNQPEGHSSFSTPVRHTPHSTQNYTILNDMSQKATKSMTPPAQVIIPHLPLANLLPKDTQPPLDMNKTAEYVSDSEDELDENGDPDQPILISLAPIALTPSNSNLKATNIPLQSSMTPYSHPSAQPITHKVTRTNVKHLRDRAASFANANRTIIPSTHSAFSKPPSQTIPYYINTHTIHASSKPTAVTGSKSQPRRNRSHFY